ncbi:hypothetical protein L228DRAFT_259335 [Xylona heveae TC161]|uniref:Uncharacterized protein n=1 Tax=Xylona heveae (strain CBS 132557 / TC161) TaxID=1328760 RepID=A0A165HXM9_XYLHT|nr:hypothetical protein L228DRAFT_259335 [Xylona heveae TC161]KZF24069.1 hypothetical protein L228DRAFT_259335 [Xylona heveae TC161]
MPELDPDGIAAALLAHYELLIGMRHLPRSRLKLPPHPIDENFARSQGLSDNVISLLKRLPYIDMSQPGHASTVIMYQTFPVDYTTLGGIWNSRDPLSLRISEADDEVPAYVNPWETLLAQAFREGENWMLDCCQYTSRGHRKGDAVEVIRQMTDSLRSLEYTPINISEIAPTPKQLPIAGLTAQDADYFLYAIKALYLDCGWPNNFRGEEFTARKTVLEREAANQMN